VLEAFACGCPVVALGASSVPEVAGETDIGRERIDARELPSGRWLALGHKLLAEDSLRDALRAFYLALLALVSEEHVITIALFKSKWDYRIEVARSRHSQRELIESFAAAVTLFDRSWYGMHKVGRQEVNDLLECHGRIASFVQPS